MNRLSFLKKLGIGMVAVVVAPKIISGSYNLTNYTEGLIPFIRKNATKWKM